MSGNSGKKVQSNLRKENVSLPPIPQHEELVRFIWDSWNKVIQDYQRGVNQGNSSIAYHIEAEPKPLPKDFVPFDLEAWWGKRLVQNITTHNS